MKGEGEGPTQMLEPGPPVTLLCYCSDIVSYCLVAVAWYKADNHFYSWANSDDALRPYPPGSNTMSLAFGREPSCVYRPLLFHGHPFPQHAASTQANCLPVTASQQSGSEVHGRLANDESKSSKSNSVH